MAQNAPFTEEYILFASESWFISRSHLVLGSLILVQRPLGKCSLGRLNTLRTGDADLRF